MKRLNRAELDRIVQRFTRQMELANGNLTRAMERLGTAVDRGILREVLRMEGVVDRPQMLRAVSAFTQIAESAHDEFQQIARNVMPKAIAATVERNAAIAGMTMSGPSLRRVLGVYERIMVDLERGVLLRSANHTLGIWHGELDDFLRKTIREVQAKVFQASVTGQSSSALARGLTDDLTALNLQNRVTPDAFARAFARTRMNELQNYTSVEMCREVDINLYINVGVPDDRQSEICYEASQENAQTLEWWEASKYGTPPRHHYNCRCSLLGVPEKIEWKQPNPEHEAASV